MHGVTTTSVADLGDMFSARADTALKRAIHQCSLYPYKGAGSCQPAKISYVKRGRAELKKEPHPARSNRRKL